MVDWPGAATPINHLLELMLPPCIVLLKYMGRDTPTGGRRGRINPHNRRDRRSPRPVSRVVEIAIDGARDASRWRHYHRQCFASLPAASGLVEILHCYGASGCRRGVGQRQGLAGTVAHTPIGEVPAAIDRRLVDSRHLHSLAKLAGGLLGEPERVIAINGQSIVGMRIAGRSATHGEHGKSVAAGYIGANARTERVIEPDRAGTIDRAT